MRPAASLTHLLERALEARSGLFDAKHQAALRLFNGFCEGEPRLVIDLYAATALLHNYADPPLEGIAALRTAQEFIRARLPWVKTILVKTRNGGSAEKRGIPLYGEKPDTRISEFGVRYAIDLVMNRDASFYMDTRNLRKWALDNLAGKTVLNTFAYTGSLGVAARAGGAARVVQLDRSRDFLNLAKASYTLNGFPIEKSDFVAEDFFPAVSRFKRANQAFDCVFLDPPFFSVTGKGRVDLEAESARLINKARPLVNHDGWLAVINNALFLSGRVFMQNLEALCASGYLSIEALVPVPEDFTGYPGTIAGAHPADPAPFNHPTKIAILRVRKD
jgi:23S rRNA (cytosine1962-C5)-methyltransferase